MPGIWRRFGFDPGMNFVHDALRLRYLDNIFDPVKDYLDSLEWDGIARVDGWRARRVISQLHNANHCRDRRLPRSRGAGGQNG